MFNACWLPAVRRLSQDAQHVAERIVARARAAHLFGATAQVYRESATELEREATRADRLSTLDPSIVSPKREHQRYNVERNCCRVRPRVTVLIPSFNAGSTLGPAVTSVLGQTLRDLEVLVIDDASSDDTALVISHLVASDSRVRAIRNGSNEGKSVSMNRGIEQATGDWIAVLDADDRYAPDRLEHLVALAECHGVDMAADNQFFVDVGANQIIGSAWPQGGGAQRFDLEALLAGSDATASFSLGMLKPVFRTAFVRRCGLRYETDARNGQDFFKLLQFFLDGGTAVLSDRPLYFYSQPFGTKSRQWSHAARKRYDFGQVHAVNERFVAYARDRVTPSQLMALKRRSADLTSLENLWLIRESMSRGRMAGAMFHAVRHPFAAKLAMQKIVGKFQQRIATSQPVRLGTRLCIGSLLGFLGSLSRLAFLAE